METEEEENVIIAVGMYSTYLQKRKDWKTAEDGQYIQSIRIEENVECKAL